MSDAGGSAQREFERRKSRERSAIKSNLPWTIPLVVVLSIGAGFLADRFIGSMGVLAALVVAAFLGLQFWGTSQHIASYGKGAEGERRTGKSLGKLEGYTVLHDRKIPGSRANIDHVVLGPGGVFVVETKNYSGKVTVKGDDLLVSGRRRTAAVEQTWREAVAVQGVLSQELARLARDVTPVLCIHGAELPWSRTIVQGVRICNGRELKNLIAKSPPVLTDQDVTLLVQIAQAKLTQA